MSADLFDTPLIPGLRYSTAVLSEAEHAATLARLSETELSPFRFQQWTGKRLTRMYGWRYDFQDGSFERCEPMPEWLLPLRDIAGAFGGIDPADFAHALFNRYDPGAGIGWHRDRPQFKTVVGLSFGSPAVLRFRERTQTGFRRASLTVEPRSAYLLAGEARHQWEHSIAPGDALRFSITFRTLSELGRRKLSAQLEAGDALGDPSAGGQR